MSSQRATLPAARISSTAKRKRGIGNLLSFLIMFTPFKNWGIWLFQQAEDSIS
jgi:hypothetical protein